MEKQHRYSIRYKILAILILLPTTALILYAFLAVRLFSQDKKAYIFDSSVVISKALATQARIEINFFQELTKPINAYMNSKNFKFTKNSNAYFLRQQRIEHMFIFRPLGNGIYQKEDHLYLPRRTVGKYIPSAEVLEVLLKTAQEVGFAMQDVQMAKRYFLFAQKIGDVDSMKRPLVVSLYHAPELYEAFAAPSVYKNYLVSKSNIISMEPKYLRDKKSRIQIDDASFFSPIFNNRFPEGISEIKTTAGHPMFVSFSHVRKGDLVVASVIDKKNALRTIDKFIIESMIFAIGLLSLTIIIGVITSFGITSALRKLVEATKEISKGNFDVKINIHSKDEINSLADSISTMASKVSVLLVEAAEKARIVTEMESLSVTQNLLFPEPVASFGPIQVAGYSQPSSECGGDWFHYSLVREDKVYIWIGDVTGHGASTSLLTSAAKAVTAILEPEQSLTPGFALQMLNTAINSITKGDILMTFFVAELDLNSGRMIYANASHESPILLPSKNRITKKDFFPLTEAKGPRLGEIPNARYEEAEHLLNPGDTVLLYTDGVYDLKNPEGEVLGERGFIKKVISSYGEKTKPQFMVETLKNGLTEYQDSAFLEDDMTLLIFKYQPSSSPANPA